MKVLRCKDIRTADQKAQKFGIAGIILMEHAAIELAAVVKRAAECYGKRIAIVCGSGNNGGDGYALARLLKQNDDMQITIVNNRDLDSLPQDAMINALAAEKLAVKMISFTQFQADDYEILVDCLFGNGLTRAIQEPFAGIIKQMNESKAYKIACDIPSGISADNGLIMGCALKVQETVSFGSGKLGLYMNDGITHSGSVTIADIGIPQQIINDFEAITILDDQIVQQCLPQRQANSHKRSYGNLLLIGGNQGMHGALLMAAEAALRCGAGLVTMMGDESFQNSAALLKEAMCLSYPKQDTAAFQKQLQQYDCIAIGNGLGRDQQAMWMVQQVWNSNCPVIFDGDALYLLGQWHNRKERIAPYALTPHPKELSYLLSKDVRDLIKNPLEALKLSENAFPNGVIVMKNTHTMISDGQLRYLNITGNHGLATGGSGDVLCGMILGMLGQGSTMLGAAVSAVYLHGKCADSLSASMAMRSVLPRDIIHQITQELMAFD